MIVRVRRLVALAAAFAPERAGRLVALAATVDEDVTRRAEALAARPRMDRLAALADAFRSVAHASDALVGAAGMLPRQAHPLWQRLVREALSRAEVSSAPSTSRTEVRPPDGQRAATIIIPRKTQRRERGTPRESFPR